MLGIRLGGFGELIPCIILVTITCKNSTFLIINGFGKSVTRLIIRIGTDHAMCVGDGVELITCVIGVGCCDTFRINGTDDVSQGVINILIADGLRSTRSADGSRFSSHSLESIIGIGSFSLLSELHAREIIIRIIGLCNDALLGGILLRGDSGGLVEEVVYVGDSSLSLL